MYSGLTIFSRHSGRLLGAHQKINRVSRKQLQQLIGTSSDFPSIKEIQHFEGINGPDGIKRKSPGQDEPWHFVDPYDKQDTKLRNIMNDHYDKLVKALKSHDNVRSAFESAWLAHAIVDGLTPAHHYPYEEELSKLRDAQGLETRTSYRKKLIMPGKTKRAKVQNNWKMWGAGGLITTHASFEMGVATLIAPLTFKETLPSHQDLTAASKNGFSGLFNGAVQNVAALDMYTNYKLKGWTPKMAWQVRHHLGPTLVRTVTLTWFCALKEAGMLKK